MRPWVETMLESHRQSRRADEFRSAAFLDPLTGLGNRRALDELRICGSYALIAMDLDHFKAVMTSSAIRLATRCSRPWRGCCASASARTMR